MALVYDVLAEAALGDRSASHFRKLEHGVFRSSAGNMYVVTWIDPTPATTTAPNQRNHGSVGIFKSPAGGASWTEMQRSNAFTIHPFTSPSGGTYHSEFGHLRCQQVGDTLHIAACSRLQAGGSPEPAEYRYTQYDMSTDVLSAWETIFEATNEVFDPHAEVTYAGQTAHGIEMHARDNGDVFFVYYGDAYVSGGNFAAIWANPILARARTSAGSWGNPFDIGPSGETQGVIESLVRSGNRTHLFMRQGSESALRTVSSGLVVHPGTWDGSLFPGTPSIAKTSASGHTRIENAENIGIAILKKNNEAIVTLKRFLDTDLAHDTFLESVVAIDDVGVVAAPAHNNYHLTEWDGGTTDGEIFFGLTGFNFTNDELRLDIVQETGAGTYAFLGYSILLEVEPDIAGLTRNEAALRANVLSYRVFNDGTNTFLAVLYIVSTTDAGTNTRYGHIKYVEIETTVPMSSIMVSTNGVVSTARVANSAHANVSADDLTYVIDRGSPNSHFRLDEASGRDAANRALGGDGLYLSKALVGQSPIADRDPGGSTSVRFGVDS